MVRGCPQGTKDRNTGKATQSNIQKIAEVTAGSLGLCSAGFLMSSMMETPQPVLEICSSVQSLEELKKILMLKWNFL